MNKDLVAIFEYLEREKGIKREIVIDAIEESLKAVAYKSIRTSSVLINMSSFEICYCFQKSLSFQPVQ